jgi:Lrp/AsnC family leucine-responsive transcriptional regulator
MAEMTECASYDKRLKRRMFRQKGLSPMEALDAVDRRLLRVLQDDGRISNAELARRCNLSPAACFERMRRLREKKIITGYAALINPAKVGRGLMIFVEVLLDRTTGDMFEAFAEAVRRQPEVLECHMVAGGFDYLIKARVGDMEAYRAFLGDVLVRMPGVRETRTYAVLEEVKSTTALPL